MARTNAFLQLRGQKQQLFFSNADRNYVAMLSCWANRAAIGLLPEVNELQIALSSGVESRYVQAIPISRTLHRRPTSHHHRSIWIWRVRSDISARRRATAPLLISRQHGVVTMGLTRSNRRLMPGFLSLSGRKIRAPSIASGGATVSLTISTEDGESFMQEMVVDEDFSPRSINSVPHSTRSVGFSRAASYLMHRAHSRSRGMSSIVGDAPEEKLEGSESGRVDDIFARTVNRCSDSALPELRLERAGLYPIVCYESDDEGSDGNAGKQPRDNVVLGARLEALKVQEGLLGPDHPDVIFLSRHIYRLLAPGESLRLSLERASTTSRAHFFPKSAHMRVPSDYPVHCQ